MREWRKIVAARLAAAGYTTRDNDHPEDERAAIDELAQLLDDAWRDAGHPDDIDGWLATEVPDWRTVADDIRRRGERGGGKRLPPHPAARPVSSRALLTNPIGWLTQSVRVLIKRPGFAVPVVLLLAVGIGFNSAVFSLVNAVLFRPPPVVEPERLVSVFSQVPDGMFDHEPSAFPDIQYLREEADSFAEVAGYALAAVAFEHDQESSLVVGAMVSGSYFDMLGVEPQLGRFIEPDDDLAASPTVAVLSHTTWQEDFGGSPSVLGHSLRINGQPATVVGVANKEFAGMLRGIEPVAWIALQPAARHRAWPTTTSGEVREGLDRFTDGGYRWLWAVGRLRSEVPMQRAISEVAALGEQLRNAHPDTHKDRKLVAMATTDVAVMPSIDRMIFGVSSAVMAGVLIVLLVICANVGNLLLLRALGRRHEIATRLALGASRRDVIGQLLVESLLLAFAGAGLAIGIAALSNRLIEGLSTPLPINLHLGLTIDWRVLAFTLVVALIATLSFGLAPALMAARTDLAGVLRQTPSAGSARHRWRTFLVVAQVAFSMLLLIASGLAWRSLHNAQHLDLGFTPDDLVIGLTAPKLQGYENEDSNAFYRDLGQNLRARSDFTHVAFTSHLPLGLTFRDIGVVDGALEAPEDNWPGVDSATVGAGYFETLRIPLVAGRGFDMRDDASAAPVVVINQTLADRLWPNAADAIGRQVRLGGEEGTFTVVGIATNGKYRTLGETNREFIWRSLGQDPYGSQAVVVRHRGSPERALAAVREEIRRLDDRLAILGLQTVEESLAPTLFLPSLGSKLFALFGILGLLLVATGLYGIIAYDTRQRRREICLRVALGAKRTDILRMVVRQALTMASIGVAVGLIAALILSRGVAGLLYGISPTDPATLVGVAAVLILVAVVAGYLPARRAAVSNPAVALRDE